MGEKVTGISRGTMEESCRFTYQSDSLSFGHFSSPSYAMIRPWLLPTYETFLFPSNDRNKDLSHG